MQGAGERELRVGREYSNWPYLKWGHAARMADRLTHDFRMWRATLGEETRSEYSEDRRVVTFYAALHSSPPVHEWSLSFGDIIHNYRSALDALTWAMAHLDGNKPSSNVAHKIYFPMKKTPESFWAAANSTLKSVPRDIIALMEMVQPYHVLPGQRIEDGIALVLNQLDINDKHKAALDVRTIAADRTHYAISYRFQDRDAHVTPEKSYPEWLADGRPLSDGDPVVRWTFEHPVEHATISDLPLRLTTFKNSTGSDVFELIRLIDQQVAETFAVVETGKFRAEWGGAEPVG